MIVYIVQIRWMMLLALYSIAVLFTIAFTEESPFALPKQINIDTIMNPNSLSDALRAQQELSKSMMIQLPFLPTTLLDIIPSTLFPDSNIALQSRGAEQMSVPRTVVHKDKLPPVFINCPKMDYLVASERGRNGAHVTFPTPVARDHVDGRNVILQMLPGTLPSGSFFLIGSTPSGFISTDSSGNTAVCNFNILVKDVEPPTFVDCPVDVNIGVPKGQTASYVEYLPVIARDNSNYSPQVSLTEGLPSGAKFPLGITRIRHVAQDAAGNLAECSFTINVYEKSSTVPPLLLPTIPPLTLPTIKLPPLRQLSGAGLNCKYLEEHLLTNFWG